MNTQALWYPVSTSINPPQMQWGRWIAPLDLCEASLAPPVARWAGSEGIKLWGKTIHMFGLDHLLTIDVIYSNILYMLVPYMIPCAPACWNNRQAWTFGGFILWTCDGSRKPEESLGHWQADAAMVDQLRGRGILNQYVGSRFQHLTSIQQLRCVPATPPFFLPIDRQRCSTVFCETVSKSRLVGPEPEF